VRTHAFAHLRRFAPDSLRHVGNREALCEIALADIGAIVDEYRDWQIAFPSLITEIGRRFRAIMRMGLTWALPWGGVGGSMTGLAVLLFLRVSFGAPLIRVAISSAVSVGVAASVIGFALGSAFGLTLLAAERNRTLSSLTATRCAAWGTLVGAALSTSLVIVSEGNLSPSGAGLFIGVCSVLGGASAAASLALAKRSDEGAGLDPALRSSSSDPTALQPHRPMPSVNVDHPRRHKSSVGP
jgi:hypothetical protein